MQESDDGSRDRSPDFRPHMPGELVETPTVEKSPSGYASSNDDEFSDAREGPQAPNVELGDVKEAAQDSSNTGDAEAKALEPLAPDAAQTPSNDLSTDVRNTEMEHVLGAFDAAEETMSETATTTTETKRDDNSTPTATAAPAEATAPQPVEPATPVEAPNTKDPETPSPVKQQSPAVSLPNQPTPPDTPAQPAAAPAESPASATQPPETTTPQAADAPSVPSTIITDVNGDSENPPTPDLEVKWNSHGERIPRKVKEEVTKFEQLMEAEKARNRNPSPASLRSARSSREKSKSPTRDLPLRHYSDAGPEPATEEQTLSVEDIDDMMPPPSPSLLPAPKSPRARRRSSAASRAQSVSTTSLQPPAFGAPESERAESVAASDGFGDDDFDDFGETVEGEEFDDFEGFEDGDAANDFGESTPAPAPQVFLPQIPVPILDFSAREKYEDGLSAAVDKMFPPPYIEEELEGPTSVEGRPFLTERSLSLWNQLVAPPPLQPPNWKVSRIRRLFLVSLGIPVDLDEILPSKRQKKLVLPSLAGESRDSTDRASEQPRSSKKQKDGDFDPNTLDIPAAKILCSTSDVAMHNFTSMELLEHVNNLENLTQLAGEVLAYWLKKRDSAVSEKEAFETVIESLVGYARKKRQNG